MFFCIQIIPHHDGVKNIQWDRRYFQEKISESDGICFEETGYTDDNVSWHSNNLFEYLHFLLFTQTITIVDGRDSSFKIREVGMRYLGEGLQNTKVMYLLLSFRLDWCFIFHIRLSKHCSFLIMILHLPVHRNLLISQNIIKYVLGAFDSQHNDLILTIQTLTTVSIPYNSIWNRGAQYLGDALRNNLVNMNYFSNVRVMYFCFRLLLHLH